jgi:hypothetical protein
VQEQVAQELVAQVAEQDLALAQQQAVAVDS